MGGDDAAEVGGAAEAIEHAVGFAGNAGDGVAGGAFVAEIGGHGAEDIGARAGEDETAIVAYAFKFAGLVGDAEVLRKLAGDVAGLGSAEEIEEVIGQLFVEDFAAIKSFEQEHEFTGSG